MTGTYFRCAKDAYLKLNEETVTPNHLLKQVKTKKKLKIYIANSKLRC